MRSLHFKNRYEYTGIRLKKSVTYKNKSFSSMTELANYLGLKISTVSKHLKRNGNLDTIGKSKNPKYKAGVIIGNKQIIVVDDKIITVKCLKCGNLYTFNKTRIAAICKREDCPSCHVHGRLKYSNIEYKGVIYSTLTEFEKKTGYDRCTAIKHLKLYGNLDKLNQKHIFKHYKRGDIINNVEFIKRLKDKNKVQVKCLECGHRFSMCVVTLYRHSRDTYTFRCKYCTKKKASDSFKAKFVKPGLEVEYKGKKYRSMHALARALGISPGKVIGQYHRHNGDLSRLKV